MSNTVPSSRILIFASSAVSLGKSEDTAGAGSGLVTQFLTCSS